MKIKKVFYSSLIFIFFLMVSASVAANLSSPENASDFLSERLIELDKIMPNEELEYLDSKVELNGEDCWEFSSQFNFNETGRYAISKSGKIYEFIDDDYKLINSGTEQKSQTSQNETELDDSDDDNDSSDLLDFDGDDRKETRTPATPATGNSKKFPMQRSTRGTKVNVRSEPDTESHSIAKLYEGTPIEVLGQRENWYQVRIPSGEIGWIFGDYIVSRLGKRGPNGGMYLWINADDVHLRSKPSQKSSSVLKLYEGHLVEAVERRGDWIKVFTRKGAVGWVLVQYLMQVNF